MMLNENYPLEKYVLSELRKNKHNIELAVKSIRNKYPFIKSNDLKTIISDVLVKKINNEKISGFWRKIENKWKMVKSDQYSGGAGFSWSGDELPASGDESSLGSARNVYSQPGDRPEGKSPRVNKREVEQVKDIMEVDTSDVDDVVIKELQALYDRMMDDYAEYVKQIKERSDIILEELHEKGFDTSTIKVRKDR